MKLSSWAARALLALAAAAAPARAAAQEAEAWVLPRGLLEVSATGSYTGWDTRLDGVPLGAELLPAYQSIANRLLVGRVDPVRAGIADLFASTTDPDSGHRARRTADGGRPCAALCRRRALGAVLRALRAHPPADGVRHHPAGAQRHGGVRPVPRGSHAGAEPRLRRQPQGAGRGGRALRRLGRRAAAPHARVGGGDRAAEPAARH